MGFTFFSSKQYLFLLLATSFVVAGGQSSNDFKSSPCYALHDFVQSEIPGNVTLDPATLCIQNKPVSCLSETAKINPRATFIFHGEGSIQGKKLSYSCTKTVVEKIVWSNEIETLNSQLNRYLVEGESNSQIFEAINLALSDLQSSHDDRFYFLDICESKETCVWKKNPRVIVVIFYDWFYYGSQGYEKEIVIKMLKKFSRAFYSLQYYTNSADIKVTTRFVKDLSADLGIKLTGQDLIEEIKNLSGTSLNSYRYIFTCKGKTELSIECSYRRKFKLLNPGRV